MDMDVIFHIHGNPACLLISQLLDNDRLRAQGPTTQRRNNISQNHKLAVSCAYNTLQFTRPMMFLFIKFNCKLFLEKCRIE